MELNTKQMYELMIAGVGGKGVLTIGKLLAEAAQENFSNVLYFPNYGPAMRGGDCECTVVFSNQPITSPVIYEVPLAIIMDQSAFEAFRGRLKKGAEVFIDSTVIPMKIERQDIAAIYVPATKMAMDLGSAQVANLVLLGAFLEKTKALPLSSINKALDNVLLGTRRESLLQLNKSALQNGAQYIFGN